MITTESTSLASRMRFAHAHPMPEEPPVTIAIAGGASFGYEKIIIRGEKVRMTTAFSFLLRYSYRFHNTGAWNAQCRLLLLNRGTTQRPRGKKLTSARRTDVTDIIYKVKKRLCLLQST